MKEELENLKAQIHFKENGIPSIHAGYLTDETITSIINLVDKEVPEHKHIKVPYYLVELQKAYENGYNQAVDDMRAKLKGVNNDRHTRIY